MKDQKKQLGDRIPVAMVDALKLIGDLLKVPKQQLTEDAIAMWMGKADSMAKFRQEMAMKAFKSGKVERPFETRPGVSTGGIGRPPVCLSTLLTV